MAEATDGASEGPGEVPHGPLAPGAGPRRRRTALPVLVIVVGVLVGWLVWSLFTPGGGYERSLPDLTLERLEGGELQLASLKGEPVIVNMWATWCPPCVRELPMMAR